MRSESNGVMLTADGVEKRYGERDILRGVSLELKRGETVAVIGRSGSGKSTLLRCLIGLERCDGGTVAVDGERFVTDGAYLPDKRVAAVTRRMGMVFQQFNLFPHLTAMENLLLAPRAARLADEAALRRRAEALLAKVGLTGMENAMPGRLSGGEKQRTAIARALMTEPEILLFDEPTSALDPLLTAEVQATIRRLADERMTMLIVTHELRFAADTADRVIYMADGLIAEEGPAAELFGAPKTDSLREFLTTGI